MRSRCFYLAFCMLVGIQSTSPAAPIILDNFSQPAGGQVSPPGGSLNGSFAAVTGVGDLNATRNLSYSGTNALTGDTFRNVFPTIEGIGLNVAGNGQLLLSTFDSAVQINLEYNGFPSTNLSAYASLDLVFVPIFDSGTGTFDIVVTLTDSLNNTKSTTFVAPVGLEPNGGVVQIPLASLSGLGNLADVTKIEIRLNDNGNPSAAADYALDQIQFTQVPEPASVLLFGGAFLSSGIVWIRKRRLRPAAI